MKLTLRTKLFLSYLGIIVMTLFLVGWVIESQINHHIQTFYDGLIEMGINPFPALMEFKGYPIFIETVGQSILLTALGAGALAMVLTFLITGYITDPIHRLIKATKEIAKGRYEERVPIQSEDEIGDLTQSLNEMAQALENQRYLKEQLITNVSHELATPLTNIGGYLEALTDNVINGKEKEKETLDLMREETERLKTMLSEVRTLAQVQEPHFKINLEEVNIKELTEKVLKQMVTQFEEKGVPLELKSDLKKTTIMLDKHRYTQIVLNLLSNALKYSPKGHHVALRLTEEKKTTILEVLDRGEGIPEKDLPFIFERFYRADQSRTRKTGGLGVGLAIVKELVEAHGGSIQVKSKVGEGSSFKCSFPRV